MKWPGRQVLLSLLLLALVVIVIGDVFPQFSLLDLAVLGGSGGLGISYLQAEGWLVVVLLLSTAACYVLAVTRRI